MGGFIAHSTTHDVTHQLNSRFGSPEALQEMVTIHQEFKLFSGDYSLQQAFRILHIVPAEFNERRGWFVFLDRLRSYQSDVANETGHDRIVRAYRENLESGKPLPVFITDHNADNDGRVTVSQGRPIVFDERDYIVISIPTRSGSRPAGAAR